jgi:hypothetical protein
VSRDCMACSLGQVTPERVARSEPDITGVETGPDRWALVALRSGAVENA